MQRFIFIVLTAFILNSSFLIYHSIAAIIQLPQTGITSCFDSAGSEIACSGTGQDGEIQAGTVWPTPRFIDNSISNPADLTVTDTLTGLIWTKNGNLFMGTWQQALDYIKTLNISNYLGHNDWRLPNVNELESLTNRNQQQTMATWLNTQGFNDVQESVYYWSSTPYGKTIAILYTPDSTVHVKGQGFTSFHAWPVRGGQSGTLTLPKTGQTLCYNALGASIICDGTGQDGEIQAGTVWPTPRFTDNSTSNFIDQSVTDNLTGLIWAKNGNLATGTWQHALDYVKTINTSNYLGHNDWRLPNINELESLANNKKQPSVATWLNTQGFYDVQEYDYWSSSSRYYAWSVDMVVGYGANSSKTDYKCIWPVRAGNWGNSTISVSPVSNDFGSVPTTTSSSQTFIISNSGTAYLAVSSISLTGSYSAMFSLTTGDGTGRTCGTSPVIAPGNSCTVSIVFSPTSIGSKFTTLQIASNDPGNATKNIDLSGVGVQPPEISVTPSYKNFSAVDAGNSSGQVFVISNTAPQGVTSLIVSSMTLLGINADSYVINPGNGTKGTCGSLSPTITSGCNCTITVYFAPLTAGLKNATLLITSNTQARDIALSGNGIGTSLLIAAISGNGGGSVVSTPVGLSCSEGICISNFSPWTTVVLTAKPDDSSWFDNWMGDCSGGGGCSFSMDSDRTVTASFRPAPNALNGTAEFATLGAAFAVGKTGETIMSRLVTFAETISLNSGAEISLKGGFNAAYTSKIGAYSVLIGKLVISSGKLTVDGLAIR